MKSIILILFLSIMQFANCQINFVYSGAVQTYTVPPAVFSIIVDMTGASGGNSDGLAVVNTPGNGGRVQTTLTVTPGQVLNLYIGGVGGDGVAGTGGTAGWNGGGDGGGAFGLYSGGGGGGGTDIRMGGTALANRTVIASGGGGAATNTFAGGDHGGNGGGLIGDNGVSGDLLPTTFGYGGTQTAGGAFGFFAPYIPGVAGSLGFGGDAGSNSAGGAGGGGYYGGGGGCWAGGGGGSSFVLASVTSITTHTAGFQTGNGYITLTPISSLPIGLTNFTALKVVNTISLAWTTASERDNDFFEVQKNYENKWETIAIIDGAGNSTTQINYRVTDVYPNNGINIYRLKQTDYNGQSTYSKIISVDFNAENGVEIFPNPAVNFLIVSHDKIIKEDIKIINSKGVILNSKVDFDQLSPGEIRINLYNLKSGVYFIQVKTEVLQFIKR